MTGVKESINQREMASRDRVVVIIQSFEEWLDLAVPKPESGRGESIGDTRVGILIVD